ncbi:MAG: hypothetical protein QOJ00_335, partial [Actinomycetota bacterium]
MPPAETEISEELVIALLHEQHPDLATRRVRFESEGWDNAIFRLGDDLAVRLPRRAMNAAMLADELRWLPVLAPALPLPVNAAVHTGVPGCGYPWAWSITPWFPGASWADADVVDGAAAARVLGAFVRALAVDAPDDAPTNPYRGGPLAERDRAVRERVAQVGSSIDADAVFRLWDNALATPAATQRQWVHGDLHPANIVVHE